MSADRPDPNIRDRTDRELLELLRRGDPAALDAGPDPAETARMRRTVLAAAASPVRRPWGFRLAWTAAVAALGVAMVLGGRALWESSRGGVPPLVADGGPRAPAGQESIDAPGAAPPSPVVEEPAETLLARAAAGPEPSARPAPPPVAVAAAPAPEAAAVREARQIQFTAPGGTRILWTLDPEFKL